MYAAALVLAACSLLYVLLIAQTLTLLAAHTVVWYSITIGLLTAAVNLAVALFALRWFLSPRQRPMSRVATAGAMASALLLAVIFAQPIEGYFAKNYYFYKKHSGDLDVRFVSLQDAEDVFRERSPYRRTGIEEANLRSGISGGGNG